MDAVSIRIASVGDREALVALQRRASLSNSGDRTTLLANPDAIEVPVTQIEAGDVFVAEVSGAIRGFASILRRSDGDAELDALFVEPESWRQGIGRALVEHCCSAAQAAGASSIHVVGNPHATGFYSACEFRIFGSTQTDFGAGLLMKRDLD